MSINHAVITDVLSQIQDPMIEQDLVSLDFVQHIDSDSNGKVSVALQLDYPSQGIAAALSASVKGQLEALPEVSEAQVTVTHTVKATSDQNVAGALEGVKNVIAVASGKGGVGKSTTTVNLALAMAAEGAKVGILDADIYGPSQGMMLGVAEGTRPEQFDANHLLPIQAHGLQSMSISYLIEDNTAMVWRGPMAAGALQQLITQTKWHDLDYLFIDMPPGTGDIQLTLSQKVPVSGSIIVTTPQDIALLDAKKGIEMFRKVDIPVLGIVENMSTHICSQCGHEEAIFGSGGGEAIAEQYTAELLGQLPLALSIRQQVDTGQPTVLADPDSVYAQSYRQIARKAAAILAQRNREQANPMPAIVVEND